MEATSASGGKDVLGAITIQDVVKPARGYPADLVGTETVLLVEDDEAVRIVIRRVLERHGYDVIEANDGVQALEVCSLYQVDLVLSDVVMPRMSGRVLVDRLKELPKRPRVLMMSGYTEDEIERHGPFPPGTPFIEKPFSVAAVTRKVRAVLDGAE